jgi:hypothetical protein
MTLGGSNYPPFFCAATTTPTALHPFYENPNQPKKRPPLAVQNLAPRAGPEARPIHPGSRALAEFPNNLAELENITIDIGERYGGIP